MNLIYFQTNLILVIAFVLSTANIFFGKVRAWEIIHITRERWIINNDLKIARAVQESLFPKPIKFSGKINYEVYRKAHNQIGGDFYDFIQLREGNLGIFFTDVAGHGISASMVAAILKVFVSTIPYTMKLSPVEILGAIDKMMQTDLNYYHASGIYIFMNFIERKIKLGNAGHPYIIHSELNGTFKQIHTEGALLGFGIKTPIVQVKEMPMITGERFFIYTDGLTESENENNKYLGEEGLLEILNLHKDEKDLTVFKNKILAEMEQYFGKKKFDDDVLFLIFEIAS